MIGHLIRETKMLSLEETCLRCGLSETHISVYVAEGLVDVDGDISSQWLFSEAGVVDIQKARRLEQDLAINSAGAILALDLMKQVAELKSRLLYFERQAREAEV